MNVRMLKLAAAAATVVAVQACEDGAIHENRGPPAGYAVLTGVVSRGNGAPVAKAEILFTRCTFPAGGILAKDTTDDAGVFRTIGKLLPVGVLPKLAADTVRVRCDITVNRAAIASDSVFVRFGTTLEQAPINTVSVVIEP